jgi:hypothetical protein
MHAQHDKHYTNLISRVNVYPQFEEQLDNPLVASPSSEVEHCHSILSVYHNSKYLRMSQIVNLTGKL